MSIERGERELNQFMRECQNKLNANAYKGTWKDLNSWELIELLKEEVNELEREVLPGIVGTGKIDKEAVRQEAADVALFTLMICDVVGGLE